MRSSTVLFFAVLASLTLSRADDTARSTSKYFKGVELYSWRDSTTDSWRFALLPGTNRAKVASEITDPEGAIRSVKDLKKRSARLAIGEYVIWRSTDLKNAYLDLPPRQVIDDIAETARSLQLNLSIPRP